ncbi:MAG: phosphomannomutase [Terriglobia bacterium]
MPDLYSSLTYAPQPLRFGTSGRRGRVVDLTQLEVSINVTAELEYLLSMPRSEGGITLGDDFFFAHDLRPSSTQFAAEENGRGEIAQAVEQCIVNVGLRPVNLGAIPTPALSAYAFARHCGSIMVTGSHIPFDLNGYKLNTSAGELLKSHEAPITHAVTAVRERIYRQPFAESPFNELGMFKGGHRDLSPVSGAGRTAYLDRYRTFFAGSTLAGMKILVYQHSAIARDMLVEILEHFGAEVIARGRSNHFVAIDTEAIDDAQLAVIQQLVEEPVTAVVSTDGDSDRPLLLGLEGRTVKFFSGDLVGMIVAEYLGADAVVVPITCSDGIDRGALASVLEPKTRVGSPWVVEGMARAREKGRRAVCGWEANGGFLVGSDFERNGLTLPALPTRDAFLPILAVLFSAQARRISLPELFAHLPNRYSRSALMRDFPRTTGARIMTLLVNAAENAKAYFTPGPVFGPIGRFDYTDGVRVLFENGDVIHFRPSGNADEFRVYAVADSLVRANELIAVCTAPAGIVRSLERAVA